MAKDTEKSANPGGNQEVTLEVKLLRYTVINDHFVLASVGWLSSYRDVLPEIPKTYVFPSSKNLTEGAGYSITGCLKEHKTHGFQFAISRFKRLGELASASWLNSLDIPATNQDQSAPPPFAADSGSELHAPDLAPELTQAKSIAVPETKYPEAHAALMRGDVPTIGVDTAKRLYSAFGDSLFEFTDGAPLVGLTGFGERRAFTAISNLRTYMNAINTKST